MLLNLNKTCFFLLIPYYVNCNSQRSTIIIWTRCGVVVLCIWTRCGIVVLCIWTRCGIVALCMAAEMMGKTLSPFDTLHVAQQRGFTKNGEMFSGTSVLNLLSVNIS